MTSTDLTVQDRHGSVPLSVLLFRLANDASRERISVGDLLTVLGDRAIGALMFFFAAPNILPVPPGVSTLLGAPLLFLSAQLMLGMRPWLPGIVTRRSLSRDDLATLVRRIVPWLAKAEKLLRPRVPVLARPPVEYLVGLVCLVLAALLMLPIPLGNTLPALAISLLALGVLERDGVWIAVGLFASVVAGSVVWGVLWAMIKAALYLLARLMS
ncbi:exopolysaccharide biosynthesis protein [Hydrogenophaga sp.]|uniref:exopolysaccharide biosynthesis protein n=1 Tax=Hydrogenophaga sp. TaxID=1904254 RepID=UPI0027318301|nr:exopolysaccharide biosynthesis protein [Hydrogenophaga sp.]MDP2017352.1 exopolysaccharide biosynthesis protein [Hydrogenophaga sp.]MDP3168602.1 exopolysaccharide biosynthesis protein [Hydrogenophaga sp.]MDP3812579.1 exopolysaccharide biosynthesis protein [Hydrogenophaga sp.]